MKLRKKPTKYINCAVVLPARDHTASCATALAQIVRPRADSRGRTNRSSAFVSSLAEQAR
jgi:hypothetical protein